MIEAAEKIANTTPARDRLTVMREIDEVKRKLASNEKTAEITTKITTRDLCDKLAASARKRLVELEAELAIAPAPAPRHAIQGFTLPDGATPYRSVSYPTRVPTQAEIDALGDLDIPPFLRRVKA